MEMPVAVAGGVLLYGNHGLVLAVLVASWRSGYAEDCKSLYPGSSPGEASRRRALTPENASAQGHPDNG